MARFLIDSRITLLSVANFGGLREAADFRLAVVAGLQAARGVIVDRIAGNHQHGRNRQHAEQCRERGVQN